MKCHTCFNMHLQYDSIWSIHKEFYVCHSCGKAAIMQLRTVLGCYSNLGWVFGMLRYTGYLDAWLLFWTNAKLITVPDAVCAAVFSWEKENPTGAIFWKEHWKIRELALVFARIRITSQVEQESKSLMVQLHKPVTSRGNH